MRSPAQQEFEHVDKEKTYWVFAVAFAGDGKTVAAAYRDNSVKIWDIAAKKDIQTLKGLPIISRDELSQHPERMIATKLADVDLVSTSGSSGKPVRFYLPKNRRSAEWAFMVKAWNQACGYALGDWRA